MAYSESYDCKNIIIKVKLLIMIDLPLTLLSDSNYV